VGSVTTNGRRRAGISKRRNERPAPAMAWSFDLLQHANLLLIRVSVVAPDHIGPGQVAPNFVHHADPDLPVLARLCARAANGSMLWRQSTGSPELQCHGLEHRVDRDDINRSPWRGVRDDKRHILKNCPDHRTWCRMMGDRSRCAYPPVAIASYALFVPKTGAAPPGSCRPILPAGVNSQSFNTSLSGYCA
jgi:hypothetical protein